MQDGRATAMTRRYTRLMLVVALALAGCTKPDWIEQTLVTVDVTGVWVGSSNRSGFGGSFEARLELEQQGPKVHGKLLTVGTAVPQPLTPALFHLIEGTVAGDVFSFKQTNGVIDGEMKVSGDDMSGYLRANAQYPMSFRRVSSSPPPASKP